MIKITTNKYNCNGIYYEANAELKLESEDTVLNFEVSSFRGKTRNEAKKKVKEEISKLLIILGDSNE